MADVSDINIRNSNNNEINYLKYSNLGKKEWKSQNIIILSDKLWEKKIGKNLYNIHFKMTLAMIQQ